MNKKPKPLIILDTPLKSTISEETIQEIVRLAIHKSKHNNKTNSHIKENK